MKNCLLIVILFAYTVMSAQEIYDYEQYKTEATAYIESGDYEDALEIYSKVHKLDPNYTEAISVRIQLMSELDQLDEAEVLLEEVYKAGLFIKNPSLYLTYGVLLKDNEKYKESNEVFLEAEAKYPRYANLLFNKAIMHYVQEDHNEAIKYLKKSILVDPDLSRAHYLLGAIALENGRIAEGFMALLGFIANSPEDEIVSKAILAMNVKLAQNYLEETEVVFSEKDDDFTELTTILRNELPLNSKYQLNCDIDDNYPRYAQAILEYASSHEIKDGFFEKTYIPWMKNVNDQGFTESFLYYSLSTMEGKIAKKVKRRMSDIESFSNKYIAKDFWNDFATREVMHFGKMTKVITYLSDGVPYMTGRLVNGKKEGNFEFVNQYGVKTIEAVYENDLVNGEVKYFHVDGEIKEKTMFKAGKRNGTQKSYTNGQLTHEITWKEDQLDGPYINYYLLGGKECEYIYKEDEQDGPADCLHENGETRYTSTFKDGKIDGERKFFYSNGVLSTSDNLADGELNGTYIDYDREGKEIARIEYKEGKPSENYISYNTDGSKAREHIIEGNKEIDRLYTQNTLSSEYLSSKDQVQKITYFDKGLENYSFQYSNGELKNIRQITNEKPKGVKLKLGKVTFYNLAGEKISYKEYNKTELNGISKFYYPNGQVSSSETFVDGESNGLFQEFSEAGELTYRCFKKNDQRNGISEFFENGKLSSRYNYKDDQVHGPCYNYHKNGNIIFEGFYENGNNVGKGYHYDYEGNLFSISEYTDGKTTRALFYLPNGEIDYEINYINLTGEQTFISSINNNKAVSNFINGVRNGNSINTDSDGTIRFQGEYLNDLPHGPQSYFHPNGEMRFQGISVLGKYHGQANWYDVTGAKTATSLFIDNEEAGSETNYYVDGSVYRIGENFRDYKSGETKYLNFSGDTILILGYSEGLVEYYVTLDKNGELTQKIELDNKQQKFESKYPNGQVAVSGSFVNNYLDAKFTLFTNEGKPMREINYSDDKLDGQLIQYYPGGQVHLRTNYLKGEREGLTEYLTEDGKFIVRYNSKNGSFEGDYEIYDGGELIKTKVYKDGELYETK